MSEGKRPGGLTALAVLNFVFGGFGLLITLGFIAIVAIVSSAAGSSEGAADAQREMAKAWEEIGIGVLYTAVALGGVSAILQIVSGIGYLQQKKFLGRTLGNSYAAVSIASSLVMVVMATEQVGGGFSIGTIVNLIYPVLTLILLNGTFKEDFIR